MGDRPRPHLNVAPGTVSAELPILWPDVPGKVHGIVSLDPLTVQCDGCAKRVDHRTLGLASEHHNLTILTCGITFNSAIFPADGRRLCRDCAKQAGWER